MCCRCRVKQLLFIFRVGTEKTVTKKHNFRQVKTCHEYPEVKRTVFRNATGMPIYHKILQQTFKRVLIHLHVRLLDEIFSWTHC